MKFFIDSANIDEIKEAAEMGLLDGVTTNPTLISKTGKPFDTVAKEICEIVRGPVSLEVTSTEWRKMIEQAHKLRKYGENVVVKIPMIPDGLKAVKHLSSEGIPTNVTLVFQSSQALMAAKAGATYVSPFIGRLDDISEDGIALIKEICTIFKNYGFKTEVLVASIRHPGHLVESAKLGAHVATIPLKIIKQLTSHPLTDKGLKQFLADWEKTDNQI